MKNIFPVAAAVLFTSPLFAVNVQQFSRSNSLVFEMLEDSRMENSHVYSDYDVIFNLGGSWVDDPFVVHADGAAQDTTPIPSLKTIHFGAGVYAKPWLMFGFSTGYSFFDWKSFNPAGTEVNSGSSSGFSDIELKTKFRIINQPKWSLAVMPFVTIPTGAGSFDPVSGDSLGKTAFLSDEGLGVGAKVIGEYLFSFMQVVVNAGYKHNSEAKYGDLDHRDVLYTGLGAYVPITQKIGANLEYSRQWTIPFEDKNNPNELYLGASAGLTRTLHAFAGFSLGNLFNDKGGNSYRVSGGLKYTPFFWSEEKKPLTQVTPLETQAITSVTPAVIETATPHVQVVKDNESYSFKGLTNIAIVRFPHNSDKLPQNESSALTQVFSEIEKNKDKIKSIQIVGHTSLTGSTEYNQKLSEKRALAVKQIFIAKGIRESLITSIGKGDTEPVRNAESPEADAENRRVEFKVELRE